MGRQSNMLPSYIESDGVFITKPLDMANYFNNYYVEKVNKLRCNMNMELNSSSCTMIDNRIMRGKTCKFEFKRVDTEEVENLLCSISAVNCAGTDCLDGRLLRTAALHISTPICHLFNACLSSGICPKLWKQGKIIPLIKNPKLTLNGQNSRPITMLSIISKLLEKIVVKQFQIYLTENNLINNAQHGYREGHSTGTALVNMSDDWLMGNDNGLLSGAILLDFSSAFDLIDHKLLIEKFKCYGFCGTAVSWLESYLFERTQCVYLNGTLSNSSLV